MTLFRQLILAVLALFITLYAGNVIVNLHNTKLLVTEQMQVHAQDTATSMALSMTQSAKEQDIATLETLFNAVSDSGYFQRIFFANLENEIIIDRVFPVSIEGVPNWFISLISLSMHEGKADVSSGWIQLGELTVVSHPGQAYKKLWQATVTHLGWFALVTLIVCLLGFCALRLILKPLKRVEKQANAICERDFELQEELPKTRELRRVVEAMNRMSKRLESVFTEQIELINSFREKSTIDNLTGLSNRSDFDARLNSFLNPEVGAHSGALMIISVKGLDAVNSYAGRAEGNALLKAIANQLRFTLNDEPSAIIARRQGPQFAVFVPDIEQFEAEQLAEDLFHHLLAVDCSHEKCSLSFNMGFSYHLEITNGPEMLSEADVALRQSISEDSNQWCRFSDVQDGDAPVLGKPLNGWQSFIEECIDNDQIALFLQPFFASDGRTQKGQEVFVRFKNEGNLISAGVIVPIAERLDLIAKIDELMLKLVIKTLSDEPITGCTVINISAKSLHSKRFMKKLDELLNLNRAVAATLVVEIAEYNMVVDPTQIRELQSVLAKYKASLAIDHFGLKATPFGYLGSLPLHHIKVHRVFTRELDQNPDNQFYIKALLQLAHTRGMELCVEGVEREQELIALQAIGVDSVQGYLLAKPRPATSEDS